jgi:hypothetical protein
MEPFRKYVMDNYEIVEPKQYAFTPNGRMVHMRFGELVVFRLKDK